MRALWVFLTCLLGAKLCHPSGPPKLRLEEVQQAAPTAYRATLALDPNQKSFRGQIIIDVTLAASTKTLWLNGANLAIRKATATRGKRVIPAKVLPGGPDFIGFEFPSVLPGGPLQLNIDYTGRFEDKSSSGIFRQQDNGAWYLFSQFEPNDARSAFPCFDEPSYKTPWQITLRVPAASSAVSNTSSSSDKVIGKDRVIVFKPTSPLPSYLVAFAVGPFEYVDAGKAGSKQVPVRIVVPRGHAGEAAYAAEITAAIINRHERYFGIPYPYEKADQLAIPDTLGFSAMENPGLVTYTYSAILAKPESDTIVRRREYARTAIHELAHQWFGDLVTTAWWNDIWLNEAFASWMEDKDIAGWKPEWKPGISTVNSKLSVANQDSLISSRQIRQPIKVKDDINDAFDGITYLKGSAVIGMFENWMGEKEFQKSIHTYLERYANRTATSGDLLDVMSTTTGKDVTKAFSTFLNQPGIPLVTIDLECQPGKASLHLAQQRFLPVGSKGGAAQAWSIPMCIRYEAAGETRRECTLLTEASTTWTLATPSCPTSLNPNDKATGYYRTFVKGNLPPGDLLPEERLEALGNAQALVQAGKLSIGDLLQLAEKFSSDPEPAVFERALSTATNPSYQLLDPRLRPNYARFLTRGFGARARQLGWAPKRNESDDLALLRPTLLELVATKGNDEFLSGEAIKQANSWLLGQSNLDPNMLSSVLFTAAYFGDKPLFDRYLDRLSRTTDKQTRDRILGAMGGFRDPSAIRAGMDTLLSGKLPFIEASSLLFGGSAYPETRHLPFEFLTANFDKIVKLMPTGGIFDFGSALPSVGASFCDTKSRDELAAFFTPKVSQFVGAPDSLKRTLERIDLCIATKAQQQPGFEVFLERY